MPVALNAASAARPAVPHSQGLLRSVRGGCVAGLSQRASPFAGSAGMTTTAAASPLSAARRGPAWVVRAQDVSYGTEADDVINEQQLTITALATKVAELRIENEDIKKVLDGKGEAAEPVDVSIYETEINALKAEAAKVYEENARLTKELIEAAEGAGSTGLATDLARENDELRQQLAALKTQLADAMSAQATVAPPEAPPAEEAAPQVDVMSTEDEDIEMPSWSDPVKFWEKGPRREERKAPSRSRKDDNPLHIVHMTAEMAPIAKVGGLGDVVQGLARACHERGHNVEVMLPYYECLKDEDIEDLAFEADFQCPKGRFWDGEFNITSLKTEVWRGRIGGCNVLLLRPDWSETNIFKGGKIYGGSYNELEAYLYFCRAGLEFIKVSGRQPHVIHVHEWQCSAAAMLYWECYSKEISQAKVMLTIHNMDNTGECREEEFNITGVPGEDFNTLERAMDERTIGHNPERMSLLKGGIVYSNVVTTVSPTYAEETINHGAAGWLNATLAKYLTKYHGVLNGIETLMWDPERDPFIASPFTASNPGGKALCKQYVQSGLGLEVARDRPLVVCITRLVPQKGVHLIRHAIAKTVALGGQFVLLGSGHSDPEFKEMAENEFKDSVDARLLIMYSDALSHHLYSAADIVLVPSMFEPCGLTQMIAMRYGAVPLVRRTGGLADTVVDVEANDGRQANGFTFDGVDEGSLDGALVRAIETYNTKRKYWDDIASYCMSVDHSWNRSSDSYLDLYYNVPR